MPLVENYVNLILRKRKQIVNLLCSVKMEIGLILSSLLQCLEYGMERWTLCTFCRKMTSF
ncbi:hypothetical protein NBRC111894_4660 [Sporolactobacillus inulinus]|uniref:Uncharacterized protein n=1 Tax=Sporolactobacillus inulinus TaxID=2078 RepID=A0A4Y1ZIR7_9BACL|nr:hypothetical protein NBRC111894_4660 [Sporolactobacillus inulinus]